LILSSERDILYKDQYFRLLVVDDEETILDLYRKFFTPQMGTSEMKDLEADLFCGTQTSYQPLFSYKLTFCKQGEEAVAKVRRSIEDDDPFSVVFLDMRLPPGRDGIWTAEQIRSIDPDIHIVVVTGYSDIDPLELNEKVPSANRLMFVRKPVKAQEIRQFADNLSKNWLGGRGDR
jgi:CheY-like chemotaxis protein